MLLQVSKAVLILVMNVCRECLRPAALAENSSTGILRDHDDSDEAVMLAALEQYESETGQDVMPC